jgi:hypothetical protein
MKAVSQTAQKVLDVLTTGLTLEAPSDERATQYRRIDCGRAGIMPLSVEVIAPSRIAVAHRYEMNGDLVPDPEMTFWRGPDERWYPASITQAMLPERTAIAFDAHDKPKGFAPKLQRELAGFTTTWMRNVVDQQWEGKLPKTLVEPEQQATLF